MKTEVQQPQSGEGCVWQLLSLIGVAQLINYFRYKDKHFYYDQSDTTDM
jgi:hypothetical protein